MGFSGWSTFSLASGAKLVNFYVSEHTPVQTKTIPRILEGANVVVASPTATGKTEAVIAPIAERFISDEWRGMSILYVVPTRALANDTFSRIGGPLGEMGLRVAVKHGDKPYLPNKLPNCIITTPESLDSLLCRYPNAFRQLRAVVLDEIHLLDNTYRGDQLRILLWRLRRLVGEARVSTHLLSATLSEPHQVGARYVQNFELIVVKGAREIDYQILHSHEEVRQLARVNGYKKVLYFCNLRESAEKVAAQIDRLWQPYPVHVHHGSLSRPIREEAEQAMKEARAAVCVATATLEVGIDIGDIDLVVLAEPPWSISALLQRIGRGNRRDGIIRAVALAGSPEERTVLEAMFETAASGFLSPEPYQPDYSVAIQQIFSILYQHPEGVTEEELLQLGSIVLDSREDVRLVLEHLQSRGLINRAREFWVASESLMDMGERGQIHSNIPTQRFYQVEDIESGKVIGGVADPVDNVFILARRAWEVVSTSGAKIRVRQFKGKASPASFQRHRSVGAFHYLLPQRLQARTTSSLC